MTTQELIKSDKSSFKLTDDEKKMLASIASNDLDKSLEMLSKIIRAIDGKPPDGRDIISKLTNVNNILERSRFPTYPLLNKQEYLRLMALYIPEAKSCEKWADLEAQALISYKGDSRKEYVEMSKSASMNPQQEFILNPQAMQEPKPIKRRFWNRDPKQAVEQSEFVNQ